MVYIVKILDDAQGDTHSLVLFIEDDRYALIIAFSSHTLLTLHFFTSKATNHLKYLSKRPSASQIYSGLIWL